MLGRLVFDLAVKMIFGAIEKAASPPPASPARRPDPTRVTATGDAYRRWARTHLLELDAAGRCYRGNIGRHAVRVAPGLEGSAPIGVEAEVIVQHGQSTTVLLAASTAATTPVEQALATLWRDPGLGDALRSIAILPDGVRLRFRPLTAPKIVERGVTGAVEELEALGRAEGAAPYR
ncbi:MAG: hypothetical protein KF795_04110 [Labilithrix sp.]|nr:hypothetical protein [Labilithrix sp.]